MPVVSCLLALIAAPASAAPPRTLLLLPIVESQHGDPGSSLPATPATPLLRAVRDALPDALRQAGFRVIDANSEVPFVLQAYADGSYDPSPGTMFERRYDLAVAVGADAALLVGLQAPGELRAFLGGSISHRQVQVTATSTAAGEDRQASDLIGQLIRGLTPALWQQAGADAEGRIQGAKERFADGQAELHEGDAKAALADFRAALAAVPEDPGYLGALAEAELKTGRMASALSHLWTLARRDPGEIDVQLRLGEAALLAGHPEQAEAAFRTALGLRADDPRAVEGLARARRARGDFAGSREQYQRLIGLLPGLNGEPTDLSALLAGQRDDTIRLTAVPPDQVLVAIARLHLQAGDPARAVADLAGYHEGGPRPVYADADYLALARGLDRVARASAQEAVRLLAEARPTEASDTTSEPALESLHARSQQLANLAEAMRVSPRETDSHRYRTLAYETLNESNYEAFVYARTNDDAHRRRSDLLRQACLKILEEAVRLEAL